MRRIDTLQIKKVLSQLETRLNAKEIITTIAKVGEAVEDDENKIIFVIRVT